MAWEFPSDKVEVGDVVLYRRRPGSPEVVPLLVTKVKDEAVVCSGFWSNGHVRQNFAINECYHVTDPRLQDVDLARTILEDDDTGVFEIQPRIERLIELERQVAELAQRVNYPPPIGEPTRNKGGRPKKVVEELVPAGEDA